MPDILVYVAVCNPSSKLYFGVTAASLKRRVSKHLSYARRGSTQKFHRAIRKYGEGSFSAESRSKLSESKRKYSDDVRAEVISEALTTSLHAAERRFGIPRQTISRWLLSPDRLEESRRKSRLISNRWYRLNHLSPCSAIGSSG